MAFSNSINSGPHSYIAASRNGVQGDPSRGRAKLANDISQVLNQPFADANGNGIPESSLLHLAGAWLQGLINPQEPQLLGQHVDTTNNGVPMPKPNGTVSSVVGEQAIIAPQGKNIS